MRNDAADFFALLILLASVNEAAGRAARFVFELVVWKRRGEETLASEGERHAAGVDR